jgi:hypothetical protein
VISVCASCFDFLSKIMHVVGSSQLDTTVNASITQYLKAVFVLAQRRCFPKVLLRAKPAGMHL